MNSVQSKPVRTKQSAVISRAQLDRQRGLVERMSAYIVLLISGVGTVVALHGGWEPIIAGEWRLAPFVGGALIQAGLTWLQWSYYHVRGLSWPARIVDAGLTAYGYGPLFVGAISGYLTSRGAVEIADVGAWIIIGLVSYGLAWYPESRLVVG